MMMMTMTMMIELAEYARLRKSMMIAVLSSSLAEIRWRE
jgi:hypothetical protein